MSEDKILPLGQVEAKEFSRFGLTWFAFSFPTETQCIAIQIAGDVEKPVEVSVQLRASPRVDQVSDFHCLTSWCRLGERWGGVRFRDFHEQMVVPQARPKPDAIHVVFIGQDGYRNTLPPEDSLADNVLLADTLDGKPLTMEHGAPRRLVAPAHYGYKSVKHIERIEFWCKSRRQHYPSPSLLSHPRARGIAGTQPIFSRLVLSCDLSSGDRIQRLAVSPRHSALLPQSPLNRRWRI